MKKITYLALLLISIYAKAGSCSAIGTGNWETAGTWSCGHVPGAGENVTIGVGFTVTVTANNTVDIGNLDVLGMLKFTNGSKINLSAASVVNVYTGGHITGGNGGAKLVFPSASFSGPFSTNGTYYYSNGGSGTGLLPLTLVSFYSSHQNDDVILYWRTENEDNIKSFEIESRTNENAGWQPVATIPSMASNGSSYSYSFTDHTKLNGDRYYHLKINDEDGKYVYSEVLLVISAQTAPFSIIPTVVYGSINVSLPAADQSRVSIFNTSGQLVKMFITGGKVSSLDVSRLSRGVYFLEAVQGNSSYTAKFLKE
ncbi:MAG TPA: T9SS type A sorting domain-containing protein [Puia sp.]|nr:T9SS type A sorting domain-containing protein [Puia sp.]